MARSSLWYRRTFSIPAGWKGKRVLLHFGAVDWEATVFVNGKEIGTHRGGYDAFSFEITDALKPSGEQEVVVAVFDPTSSGNQPRGKQVNGPRGIWYTPTSGIWQTAWLEPVPSAYIRSLHIIPDVDGRRAIVEVDAVGAEGCSINADVRAEGFAASASVAGKTTLVIRIPNPRLWSPDSPHLYDLVVSLKKGGQVLDAVKSYFGMRKVSLGKDAHGRTVTMLNDKPIFFVGPLDQGFWPDGLYAAATDEALRYDVEVMKKLGFNCARKHVKIEPDRWYYWCDKLGLMVWQDMPNGNNRTPESRKQFERELIALVKGRWNHPSIVMWVPFNEGWGQHDTARYVALIKKLDPTRLVNNASGWADKGAGDIKDIHSYRRLNHVAPEPRRAAVIGEFGGLGLGVDGHTWAQRHWGYTGTAGSQDLTRKYVALLRELWARHLNEGLSGCIYTQITDVETECNGLLTYDRAIIKVIVEDAAKANRGQFPPPPERKVIVPTSEQKPHPWRYTTARPPADWFKPSFDDSAWKEGPGGFGTKGTPGAVVRTTWNTPDIWLRREVTLPETKLHDPQLWVHHDEDVEVYINGVLATKAGGYTTAYEELPLTAAGRKALRSGKNLIAIHCKQTRGGQYIDLGIIDLVPRK